MRGAHTLLVALLASAGAPGRPPATLVFENREVVTFRATVHGSDPGERVRAAAQRLDALPPAALDGPVTAQAMALGDERGVAVLVGGRIAFVLVDGDRDPLGEEPSVATLAASAADRLSIALRAWREQHSPRVLLRGLWRSGAATVLLAIALGLAVRLGRIIAGALSRFASREATARLRGRIDVAPAVAAVVRSVVRVLFWSTFLVLLDVWLTFVLRQFPLTSPWADALTGRVLEVVAAVGLSMLHAIPGLVTVAVILLVARFAAGVLRGILDRVERGAVAVPGLYPETIPATRRIVSALVWLVALAAAYPYIPGSSSDAVKGLSLVVGVMVSLGSAGLVSQAMSGLALIYARALSVGDTVRIGEVEGVVTELGLLSTKLVTIPGEEVTFPNTVVIGGSVRNYTRLARAEGPLVVVRVGIGYDAPWRQVHALLLEAARETAGLRAAPAPFVLQRALSDFYVEYELVARLEAEPSERPRVVSELHAHVQDGFNAAGVQIMSPHFAVQPREPVVIPRERWDPRATAPPERRRG